MTHEEIFGVARWIGCGGATSTPCIRAAFQAPPGATGFITICGLGYFELYINGCRVSDDLFVPVTSDYCAREIIRDGHPFPEKMRHRCYAMRYPMDGLLQEGENQLAVALGPGFFATPSSGFDAPLVYGEVRLCYRIEMAGSDGACWEAVSGADARWTQGIVTECDFLHGERHDLRRLEASWTTVDFFTWESVMLLPQLDTDFLIQDCPADRIIRRITPQVVNRFPGCTVYDAGENLTGWVVLEDRSAAGESVAVHFSENLSCCGALDELYMHWQFFEVISDGHERLLHPHFTWNAFRYFAVAGKAEVKHVAVIHSDIAVASAFQCSHPTLNWLYEAYVRTQLNNLHGGIPSDCPHLERRGYTGDGQLTAETALLTLNHASLMRKWMRDIADCQDIHTGHVQNTAPYIRSGGGPGGWGSAIILVPWAYYRHTGDREPLRAMHGDMVHYLEYLRMRSEGGLVIRDVPGEWCLGDWCCPGGVRIPAPFVNTYFLVRALDTLCRVEAEIEVPVQPQWSILRQEAVEALYRCYFDPQTGDFAGGIQGANAFALDIGLGDERTLRRLIRHYESIGGYDTGIFGTEVVTRVLMEKGYASLACRLLTSEKPASYHGWRQAGATTLWEYWPGDIQRSMNHPMFGAPVKELFYHVLGLRQTEDSAGWATVVVAPELTEEIPAANGYITTPRGILGVKYCREGNRIHFVLEVPEGMRGILRWQGKDISLQPGKSEISQEC